MKFAGICTLLFLFVTACGNVKIETTVEENPATSSEPLLDPDKKNVAVLLYEHVILMDFVPAAEIFRAAGHGAHFNVFSVAKDLSPQPSMMGIAKTLQPDFSLEGAPKIDILLIPGGNWPALKSDSTLHAWMARRLSEGATLMTVCTGAYVAAQAGLLADHDVTSLHAQLDLLKQLEPKARVHDDVPFVVSGNIVTCAGAATSIDAALHVVREQTDLETAQWIAETYLDYGHWNTDFKGSVSQ